MKCEHCPASGRCVVDWTGHTSYCEWAAAGGAWREKVAALSEQRDPNDAPSAPRGVSLATMATNATGAVVRVVNAVVHREPVFVDADVLADRKAKCETCDHLKGGQCDLCGCFYAMKIRLKTESCPDKPPQW